MKINDSSPTYIPLISNIRTPITPNEKIQNEKKYYYYYDNSNICQYYGQGNIEKCIFLLFFLITYTSTILYYYINIIGNFLFYFIILTLSIDSLSFIFYCYFLYKLKSDDIFEKILSILIQFNDTLIIINSIFKTFVLSIVSVTLKNWIPFLLFSSKYILDIYLMLTSIKIFMFCPGVRSFQEFTDKFIFYFKTYILCCEVEFEQENETYGKFDDSESFY